MDDALSLFRGASLISRTGRHDGHIFFFDALSTSSLDSNAHAHA